MTLCNNWTSNVILKCVFGRVKITPVLAYEEQTCFFRAERVCLSDCRVCACNVFSEPSAHEVYPGSFTVVFSESALIIRWLPIFLIIYWLISALAITLMVSWQRLSSLMYIDHCYERCGLYFPSCNLSVRDVTGKPREIRKHILLKPK